MLHKLKSFEPRLGDLIRRSDLWEGLYIGYHPPIVYRAWTTIDHDYRLSLHIIDPCNSEDALFHPHPWASAIKIVNGLYEMKVGYGKGNELPPVAATIILPAGSYYEMVEPDGWHSVRPIGTQSLSVMVTSMPWNRKSPGGGQARSMTVAETQDVLDRFKEFF